MYKRALAMDTALTALIVLGLGATLVVLGVGVVSMLRGGEFNRRYGNKIMRARVVAQGVTILLILLAFVLLKGW